MKFNAAAVLRPHEVDELVSHGFSSLRMHWVETDKNALKRRNKDYEAVPPLLKYRLVRCGNFADTDGLGTDNLIADVDTHNLVA